MSTRAAFEGQVGSLPDDVREPLLDFDSALREVEEHVDDFGSRDWAELTRGLPPLEAARLNVMCAYTLNALFYMYLKVQGVSTADHPVKQELERVRQYLKKVKGTAQHAKTERHNGRLNVDAAKRFITHALNDPGAGSAGGTDTSTPAEQSAGTSEKKKRASPDGARDPASSSRKKKKQKSPRD